MEGLADEIKRRALRERPYADRVGLAFALSLESSLLTRGPYFQILRELDFLEGIYETSCAVAATQFKHPPLYPFWHKHFTTARHIPNNLILRWGNTRLQELIDELWAQHGHDPETFSKAISYRIVYDGYRERTRQGEAARVRECPPGEKRGRGLTGDWIIYGKHEGQNYYLDLATHQEGKQPEALYEKLRKGCATEFPFLFP